VKPGSPPATPVAARSRARRLASRLFKIGVSVGALLLVARHVDVPSMTRVLAAADPFLVAAVALLYLAGQAMTAWRWRLIASRVGFDQSLGEFTRYYYIGMFFNLFGPSTLGGDVVRALYLGAAANRRTASFHTVLFDRLSGVVMLVMVALVAMLLFGRFGLPWPVMAVTVAMGVGLTVGWWLLRPMLRRVLARDHRMLRLVENELGPFWRDRDLLVKTALISAGFHLLQVCSLILLGRAVSMQVDWRYYFIFHPLVTVLTALPVSMAGLGVREAGYVWFLRRQGVPGDTAFAFGLLWFGVLLVATLVGGLVYLWSGAAMPPLRGPKRAASGPSEASVTEEVLGVSDLSLGEDEDEDTEASLALDAREGAERIGRR
jgi:uncharacterized membrane protein YbhN (UPF0104 family)